MVILQAIEQGKPVPAEVLKEVLTEIGTTGEPGLTSEPRYRHRQDRNARFPECRS